MIGTQLQFPLESAEFTHKHDRSKHNCWDACDVNGDVDLSSVSMWESLFGKTIADVLKSESHRSLLKFDPVTISTDRLYVSSNMASRVRRPVKWLTWLTGWSFEFQRNSEVARTCGQTGLWWYAPYLEVLVTARHLTILL